MTTLLGQAWLTARRLTGGLLLASVALSLVGIMMFVFRVFLHSPAGTRPGYYQSERGFIISGVAALALGLAGLSGLLRPTGDPVFADVGLAAGVLGAGLLILTELTWLSKTGLPVGLMGAWLRMAVILLFVAQVAYGASLLQTGLLPAWLGWLTVVWNLGWLAVLARANDPYYPVLHFLMPLLAGILLLAKG